MLEIMYELPSIQGLKECVITREVILNREKADPGLRSERTDGLSGTLFVVATRSANLEDITLRALRVLREANLVACEDTRRTRALLTHFDIHKPTVSYYEHNKLTRGRELLRELAAGRSIALVTDAGTPGISDPGVLLVREARAPRRPGGAGAGACRAGRRAHRPRASPRTGSCSMASCR